MLSLTLKGGHGAAPVCTWLSVGEDVGVYSCGDPGNVWRDCTVVLDCIGYKWIVAFKWSAHGMGGGEMKIGLSEGVYTLAASVLRHGDTDNSFGSSIRHGHRLHFLAGKPNEIAYGLMSGRK